MLQMYIIYYRSRNKCQLRSGHMRTHKTHHTTQTIPCLHTFCLPLLVPTSCHKMSIRYLWMRGGYSALICHRIHVLWHECRDRCPMCGLRDYDTIVNNWCSKYKNWETHPTIHSMCLRFASAVNDCRMASTLKLNAYLRHLGCLEARLGTE